jgi:uncharacterized protein
MDELLPRRALASARRRLSFSRVVVINGPRQSGKTVLLRVLHEGSGGTLYSFDDARSLRPARIDPGGFVRESSRPTFIDEVQRAGNPLVLAIKAAVDESSKPGQFVLAGSTRFLFEPRLSESLAGRALFVDLWPFSQGEIDQTELEDFATIAFRGPEALMDLTVRAESRLETFERVCRGGMPTAIGLSRRDRRDFLGAYARTLSSRDVAEMGRIPSTVDLLTLTRAIAGRTAGEHNVSALARSFGCSPEVMTRMLGLLESVYVHYRLPAWSRNLTSKVARKPKIHMTDSGLAAALCGVDAEMLRRPEATVSGAVLETFVVGELSRQLTWSDSEATMFHWRDRDGAEVDVVLELPTGPVVGIEVKAALDIDASSVRGLRTLRDRLGDRFVAGVILHCGDRVQWVEDRLIAMPVSALWAEHLTQ